MAAPPRPSGQGTAHGKGATSSLEVEQRAVLVEENCANAGHRKTTALRSLAEQGPVHLTTAQYFRCRRSMGRLTVRAGRGSCVAFQDLSIAFAGAGMNVRDRLFREHPLETLQRLALGMAWRLAPARVSGTPAARACMCAMAAALAGLPDPEATLRAQPNVAGIAHDLSVTTLVAAYSRGLYPLSHVRRPMAVAAGALRALLSRLPHLQALSPGAARRPLQGDLRRRLRPRHKGLRRTAPRTLSPHLDHPAYDARLCGDA